MIRFGSRGGGRARSLGAVAAAVLAACAVGTPAPADTGAAGDALAPSTGAAKPDPGASAQAPPAAADSLVTTAYYFHRTFRCETCIHMEEVIAGVLEQSFSAERASGRLRWMPLDFEDEANAPLYADYGLEDGPAFVLSRRLGGRELDWLELAKIWEQSDQPERLTEYLRAQIKRSLRPATPEEIAPSAPSTGAGVEGER